MRYTLLFFIVAILFIPCAAAAHGDSASLEATLSSGTLIDIGYSAAPVSGEGTIFDFVIRNSAGEEIAFDRIWVRLSKGSAAYLATGLAKAEIGKTVLTYRFPEAGSYEMEIRFEKGGDRLAEHTFVLEAGEAESTQKEPFSTRMLLSIIAAFFVGGSLIYFFFPRTR